MADLPWGTLFHPILSICRSHLSFGQYQHLIVQAFSRKLSVKDVKQARTYYEASVHVTLRGSVVPTSSIQHVTNGMWSKLMMCVVFHPRSSLKTQGTRFPSPVHFHSNASLGRYSSWGKKDTGEKSKVQEVLLKYLAPNIAISRTGPRMDEIRGREIKTKPGYGVYAWPRGPTVPSWVSCSLAIWSIGQELHWQITALFLKYLISFAWWQSNQMERHLPTHLLLSIKLYLGHWNSQEQSL